MTYTQKEKNNARHEMIKHAIQSLTINRSNSGCVDADYVRNIYDYFISLEEGNNYVETKKINVDYILEWEKQRNIEIGNKKPEDLTVCYLAGPEPENDFKEFISLGVLPQNIWAFESNGNIYSQALASYDTCNFKQPKILKMSIEKFFQFTPKKFDIVYIDACGTLISDKHALRCIATLFKYHRLHSLGVLLTNFSEIEPDNTLERKIYTHIMSKYFLLKEKPDVCLIQKEKIEFNEINDAILERLDDDFDFFYGEFITSIICDTASVSIPSCRFANSGYINDFINMAPQNSTLNIIDINSMKNNSLLKFFLCNEFLKEKGYSDCDASKIDKLSEEITGISPQSHNLIYSMDIVQKIKNNGIAKEVIKNIYPSFDSKNMHQFLDCPNKNLFLDLIINQFSYPMHYVTHQAKRLTYKAKETKMYMDLMVFDECRYIYEWVPSIYQIKNAFQNLSWQYVFRFAVDGLVKQRIKYNNEFFFQGSVVSKEIEGFKEKELVNRKIIGG